MAAIVNIEDTHRGENLIIRLFAKNPDETVISDPFDQSITLTISKTEGGGPFLSFKDSPWITLIDLSAGEWLINIPFAQLNGVQENKSYFYNIWSDDGSRPWLQAKGRLKRLNSIKPEA
jgi:hypothetical protein